MVRMCVGGARRGNVDPQRLLQGFDPDKCCTAHARKFLFQCPGALSQAGILCLNKLLRMQSVEAKLV